LKPDETVKNRLRCCVYTRVSTDEQVRRDNNSLETQEEYCDRYIALHEIDGYYKVKTISDPGYSAGSLKRPGVQELIREIKSGTIDMVVIYKLDRLSRSIGDFYELWSLMEEHKVGFVSATQQFDTTSALGRVMLNILMSFAQFEREMTCQRLTEKFEMEAREGRKHSGMTPFGYDVDKANHSIVPNEEESAHVREMYRLVTELKSSAAVAKAMNAKGLRTKTHLFLWKGETTPTSVGNRPWTSNKIQKLISNPLYKSIRLSTDGTEYKGVWTAVVSIAQWKAANESMKSARPRHGIRSSLNTGDLALKGLLYCGHCGFAMTPKRGGSPDGAGRQRAYYTCQEVIRQGVHSDCDVRSLPGQDFDDFVVRMISELGKRPEIIQSTLSAAQAEKKKSVRPLKTRLAELGKEIKKLEAEMRNCMETAKAGGAGHFSRALLEESEALSRKRDTARQDYLRLRSDIRSREMTVADEKHVAAALANFSVLYKNMRVEERSELMGLLIRKVSVSRFNPEKHDFPNDMSALLSQPSTEWYRLNFNFHITSMFEAGSTTVAPIKTPCITDAGTEPVKDDDSDAPAEIRTRMAQSIIVGVVSSDWANGSFVVHPFQTGRDVMERAAQRKTFRLDPSKHVLATALEWKAAMDGDPHVSSNTIAKQVGLTSSRVRQILKLVGLHPKIQQAILTLPSKTAKTRFSDRFLQALVVKSPKVQLEEFEAMPQIVEG
jgi:site-specific DNA recombinase